MQLYGKININEEFSRNLKNLEKNDERLLNKN